MVRAKCPLSDGASTGKDSARKRFPALNWISLALRNLLRNSRRSITTVGAVALGYAATNIFAGFAGYMFTSVKDAHIYEQVNGHVQIWKKGARDYGGSALVAMRVVSSRQPAGSIGRAPVPYLLASNSTGRSRHRGARVESEPAAAPPQPTASTNPPPHPTHPPSSWKADCTVGR